MTRSDEERVADILDAAAEIGHLVTAGKEAWNSDRTRLGTVLAHHYHHVDPDQVWTIASHEVPRLVERLQG